MRHALLVLSLTLGLGSQRAHADHPSFKVVSTSTGHNETRMTIGGRGQWDVAPHLMKLSALHGVTVGGRSMGGPLDRQQLITLTGPLEGRIKMTAQVGDLAARGGGGIKSLGGHSDATGTTMVVGGLGQADLVAHLMARAPDFNVTVTNQQRSGTLPFTHVQLIRLEGDVANQQKMTAVAGTFIEKANK